MYVYIHAYFVYASVCVYVYIKCLHVSSTGNTDCLSLIL